APWRSACRWRLSKALSCQDASAPSPLPAGNPRRCLLKVVHGPAQPVRPRADGAPIVRLRLCLTCLEKQRPDADTRLHAALKVRIDLLVVDRGKSHSRDSAPVPPGVRSARGRGCWPGFTRAAV